MAWRGGIADVSVTGTSAATRGTLMNGSNTFVSTENEKPENLALTEGQ